ncbi:menaquinone biosynthesis protein [Candidatus Riflebacteria bacterium]
MSDTEKQVVIGRISYANCDPIFYSFENREWAPLNFVQGQPKQLNELFCRGLLDCAPLSSVVKYKYGIGEVIDNWGIACRGKVRSIILFSSVPFDNLEDSTLLLSPNSESCNCLLKVLLYSRFGNRIKFIETENSEHQGLLKIGTNAFTNEDYPFKADLGEIWLEETGLPFVYALFLRRNDLSPLKLAYLDEFFAQVKDSIQALDFNELAGRYSSQYHIPEGLLQKYYSRFTYQLGKEEEKGLDLFIQLCKKFELF